MVVYSCWWLIGALVVLTSCRDRQERVSPVRGTITESVYASGIIKSDEQYEVFAATSGIVSKVFVSEGDLLKKGDVLMRLSDTTARLSEAQARLSAGYAAVAANKNRLAELQSAVDQSRLKLSNDSLLLLRQQRLWSQNIGTRIELEQRELNFRNSSSNLSVALVRYAELQRQIDLQDRQSRNSFQIARSSAADHIVRSVVDGKVYSLLKKAGEMVTAQTPVAVVGRDHSFLLELQVDEYDIARVKKGLTAVLIMDSYKEQVFEAVIAKVYPMMHPASKSFTVEASFTRPPPVLYPNLTCEANIIIRQANGITIPAEYLLPGNLVLQPGGKKTTVVTGARDYQRVEILQGLTENDIILKPSL